MSAPHSEVAERLDALMHASIARDRLPGLAIVVERDGEAYFAAGSGRCDATHSASIDPDTMFGVASLTKLMTAVALLRLQDRGLLSLDDPVSRYFPTLHLARQQPIRLSHLLGHSAGWPGLPGRFHARNLADPDDRSGGVSGGLATTVASSQSRGLTTAAELVELINALDVQPLAAPGELVNYSNEGYCLLGGVIEAVTQQRYADALQALVLEPLRMSRTAIGGERLSGFSNVAMPLAHDAEGWREAGFWDAPLFYPTGGAVASARDLVRLMRVLDREHPLLTPASRGQLLQCGLSVASRPGGVARYGLALEHHRIDTETVLHWHSGQRAGVSSFMGWLPAERLALAVLTNVADAPAATIGHRVLGCILGREDIGWPPPRLGTPATRRDAAGWARFVGDYGTAEGFDVLVQTSGDDLVMVRRGACELLRFVDADSGTVGEQTFRFLSDTDGRAWAVALDLRVLPSRRRTAASSGASIAIDAA